MLKHTTILLSLVALISIGEASFAITPPKAIATCPADEKLSHANLEFAFANDGRVEASIQPNEEKEGGHNKLLCKYMKYGKPSAILIADLPDEYNKPNNCFFNNSMYQKTCSGLISDCTVWCTTWK